MISLVEISWIYSPPVDSGRSPVSWIGSGGRLWSMVRYRCSTLTCVPAMYRIKIKYFQSSTCDEKMAIKDKNTGFHNLLRYDSLLCNWWEIHSITKTGSCSIYQASLFNPSVCIYYSCFVPIWTPKPESYLLYKYDMTLIAQCVVEILCFELFTCVHRPMPVYTDRQGWPI